MLEAATSSIAIRRDWRDLYEAIRRAKVFPRWASGLSKGTLARDGERWVAKGPEGPATIRFSPHNDLGVKDHWVEIGDAREVYVPLRIVANEDGAEAILTFFANRRCRPIDSPMTSIESGETWRR